ALAARAEALWLHGTASADFLEQLAAAYELGTKQTDPWIRGELAFWLWRHGRLDRAPRGIARPFAPHIAGDWRAAAGAWETLGCPYEQAVALADSDEESPLRAALELLKRLDAAPMMAILRRKLRARGVRGIPRGAQQRTRQNPFGMTRRELEVLG